MQLFDLADTEYLKELVNKIKFVFDIALNTATTDEKTRNARAGIHAVIGYVGKIKPATR